MKLSSAGYVVDHCNFQQRSAEGFAEDRATTTSKFAILVSPTGTIIDLCQHVK